jgi:formyltetrahydrofolate-dependent phosphoribosylglycinamide formyltransferase
MGGRPAPPDHSAPTRPLRLAVLLSGTGRTLENLLASIAAGELDAAVVAVVSSRPSVRGLEVAASAGIPAATVRRRDHPDDTAYSDAVYAAVDAVLAPAKADLIVLAGFLRKLVVPDALANRILNIHPALLPEAAHIAAGRGFYGERVHAAVLASGATASGATVHVVDNGYDTGPVVLRERVPVLRGDTPETLGARVFAAECRLYPAAIRRHVAAHPELFGAHSA